MTLILPPETVEKLRRTAQRHKRSSQTAGSHQPPAPPRRVPPVAKPTFPLSPKQTASRLGLGVLAALLLGFTVYLMVYGPLVHVIAQSQLNRELREQLAAGTAPVSEGTFEDVLLENGAPVAQITIPQLDIDETVVEGTSSGVLVAGPGHRRDTVLPGQAGVAVVMGRAAAFGGPFGRIQELQPGDAFTVVTGQGEHTYEVIGVRYAADPAPAPIQAGDSRLILETARGPAYLPSGVVRVDAELTSTVQNPGARQTSYALVPAAAREMGMDVSHLWALVFGLQALVLIEAGAVWAMRRIGTRQAWVVFLPPGMVAALAVCDQMARLLPNLL